MYCTQCGSPVGDSVNYCPTCGSPKHAATTTAQTARRMSRPAMP
ncbi:zinc-ribbon domain-containing protein [Phytoactinopolyspora endophytica]